MENEEVSRLAAAYLFFENTSQAIRHLNDSISYDDNKFGNFP